MRTVRAPEAGAGLGIAPRVLIARSGLVGLVLNLAAAAAFAQAPALERNLPPVTEPPLAAVASPPLPVSQDPTPLGPRFTGLVVLGTDDPVRRHPGVAAAVAGTGVRLSPRELGAIFRPLAGRPLSRKLISDVETAIVRRYRDRGYPFISVSTPQQELTAGVLQIRVVEFRAGKLSVKTKNRAEASRLADSVRFPAGRPISATALAEDLDELNRYPYRHVGAVFSPGAQTGEADLLLTVDPSRPFTIYAGQSNAGSRANGRERYFLGLQVGDLLEAGSLLAYQGTASGDGVADQGSLFPNLVHARYASQALHLVLPANPRAALEVSLNWVETNSPSDPFSLRSTVEEASADYRFALSNLPGLGPDSGALRLGIEAKRETDVTSFGGQAVLTRGFNAYQALIGYDRSFADPLGHSDLDLALHLSPGGLDDADSDARALLVSQGRVTGATYGYVGASLRRVTALPTGASWTSALYAQYASRPLPRTEQMGIGGADLVRGYALDDGAYDSAIVARNELHARPIHASVLKAPIELAPYLFADAGAGRDQSTKRVVSALSGGLGADVRIDHGLALSVDGAYAAHDATYTHAGQWRLELRAVVSY